MIANTGTGLPGCHFATPMVSRQGKQTFQHHMSLKERVTPQQLLEAKEAKEEEPQDPVEKRLFDQISQCFGTSYLPHELVARYVNGRFL